MHYTNVVGVATVNTYSLGVSVQVAACLSASSITISTTQTFYICYYMYFITINFHFYCVMHTHAIVGYFRMSQDITVVALLMCMCHMFESV